MWNWNMPLYSFFLKNLFFFISAMKNPEGRFIRKFIYLITTHLLKQILIIIHLNRHLNMVYPHDKDVLRVKG